MKGFFGDRYEKFSDQVFIWWQMSPYLCLVWKAEIFIFRSKWWLVWNNFKWWPVQMVTNSIWNEWSVSFQMVTQSNGDIFGLTRIKGFISNGDTIKWWHIWLEMKWKIIIDFSYHWRFEYYIYCFFFAQYRSSVL